MPGDNGGAFKSQIETLLIPFAVELEKLTGRRAEIVEDIRQYAEARRAEIAEINAQIEIITRIEAAAQPRKRRQKATRPRPRFTNDETVNKVLACVESTSEPVSAGTIAEQLGLSVTTVNKAIGELRRREQVRAAGVDNSGHGRAPKLYAAMRS